MENSEDEMEEDETEWKNSFVDSVPFSPAAAPVPGLSNASGSTPADRVILHFDLDCFYAQVEMIRNPALREVPLGIQQKYFIVTCNYVAREQGLTKMMSVTDAKEKCPQLVLVNGEDLTHYREMSYKVTELLMSYCPLVERLGLDENFMDVTEMVERRLAQTPQSNNVSFKGHVYNHCSADVKASDHPRLALGSHIAAELKDAIHTKLGLTGCAGIATNKLLAKLVSGTFKPNQQTTLLPENISNIIGCLSSLRKVPGVGPQTAKRLQALGFISVKDLQLCSLNDLVREFGGPSAQRLKNLVLGVDNSPVTPTGAPQSLSDEDSFKKISSTKGVLEKIQQLLSSLVERMQKDGRQPQTFRLTIRRFSATKWLSRESRQCPIPSHTGQKITSGSSQDAVGLLVPLAMKLFHKLVDSSATFHLTLINVCFSNLQTRGAAISGKGSITSFFTNGSSPRKTQILSSQCQDSSPSSDGHCMAHQFSTSRMITQNTSQKSVTVKSPRSSEAALHGFKWKWSTVVSEKEDQKQPCSTAASCLGVANDTLTHQLPPYIDPEVFRLLPKEIQEELLSPTYRNSLTSTSASSSAPVAVPDESHVTENKSPCSFTESQNIKDITDSEYKLDRTDRITTVNHQPAGSNAIPEENITEEGKLSPDCEFPGNVDLKVFSELPPDVQRELMSEWKQRKLVLKAPSSKKTGQSVMTKDRKAAAKGNQANSLLKYFKPN
ncbi:DNA polymerase iota [Mastacembelus armatus]|uniref:Polymerase (DNA directed) iota n=1 Tax=Mastacembelus armatus TaxID=205130 RepID=A0A3Q3LG02_9TELE|nr:DNA polymerase iota [Mastacembelus armatus]